MQKISKADRSFLKKGPKKPPPRSRQAPATCLRKQMLLLLLLAPMPRHAAFADATTEAQLRAALQQATAQNAQLEDQLADLQASLAPNAAMINTLQAELQRLKQQGGQSSLSATVASTAQAAAEKRQLAAEAAELGKTQAAYAQAAGAAQTAAAVNAQLTVQLAAEKTKNNSCDAKNAALYALGNQILDAYAHKDDGLAAFANHEPFIGFARVKLQNIVQDDQDKLFENQVNP